MSLMTVMLSKHNDNISLSKKGFVQSRRCSASQPITASSTHPSTHLGTHLQRCFHYFFLPFSKYFSKVQIGLDNFEILKIDDRDFTIEINAYFIVKWRDRRLQVNMSQIRKHFSDLEQAI